MTEKQENLDLSAAKEAADFSSATDRDPDVQLAMAKAQKEQVDVEGRKKFYDLRDKWSKWIIGWITGLIIFNSSLAVLVGLGYLDFSKYEWFITIVTVETFLQIVGMGYVAVKFLFSDNSN